MKVEFSKIADDELKDYKGYLLKLKKEGKLPSYVEIPKSLKKLKDIIIKELSRVNNHKDSIYPKDCDFGEDYKIGIGKEKHYISFYEIVKDSKGESYISIEKCLHSTKLKKELDKKGIKPLEDSDPQLLLDYITIEREDKVNDEMLTDEERDEYNKKEKELESRIESQNKKERKKKEKEEPEDKGKEEEVYDEETGKTVKQIVYTGPKGGRFYKSDNGENVYVDESKTFKSLSSLLLESKRVSLSQYIKDRKVL